jgi:hypothetical protein
MEAVIYIHYFRVAAIICENNFALVKRRKLGKKKLSYILRLRMRDFSGLPPFIDSFVTALASRNVASTHLKIFCFSFAITQHV